MQTNHTASEPAVLAVNPGGIPAGLRSRPQWVCWVYRWLPAQEKWTKIPINPNTGTKASSIDPATWASFDQAMSYAGQADLIGIGYVFSPTDPFTGVDLDGCREPETGQIAPWAAAIVRDLSSYSEVSPSGTGVHIIVEATKPAGRSRKGSIEMYDRGRYFTMTGHRLPDLPATVECRQTALDNLHREAFDLEHEPARNQPAGDGSGLMTDDGILEKLRTAKNATKFVNLWAGDAKDYGSASEADLALCTLIAFYTSDAAQVDRLLRRSGLMRDKWERSDYRQGTIAKALSRTEQWSPGGTEPRRNRAEPAGQAATHGAAEPPTVDPFPDHILPPAARDYCVSAARSLGVDVPVAMVAAPFLAFVGALAGNRVYLAVKGRSWIERGGLFVGILGKPGSIKSPAIRHARWPLTALEEDAARLHDQAMARYKEEYAVWRKDQSGDEPERPRRREYFTSDATMEALAELLGRNPGVCIIMDELLGWVLGFDKYRSKGGNDRQQALSMWGSETIKVNRKTGNPLYVSSPVASVAGGLQPDFADAFQAKKNATDGLTERLLPVVCDHGSQAWTDVSIAQEQYRAVADLFRQLDRLPVPDQVADGPPGIGIELSLEARRLWIDFFDANSRRVNVATGLEAGMLQKLSTHTARFALILHLLQHADDPRVMVNERTMASAIELSDWWRGHINSYLWLLGMHAANFATTSLSTRIQRSLQKDRSDKHDGWVTRSTIYRDLRNVEKDALTAALAEMQDAGTVERRVEATATKPIEWWRLAEARSQYSQYSQASEASEPVRSEIANNANGFHDHAEPMVDDDLDPDIIASEASRHSEPEIEARLQRATTRAADPNATEADQQTVRWWRAILNYKHRAGQAA